MRSDNFFKTLFQWKTTTTQKITAGTHSQHKSREAELERQRKRDRDRDTKSPTSVTFTHTHTHTTHSPSLSGVQVQQQGQLVGGSHSLARQRTPAVQQQWIETRRGSWCAAVSVLLCGE